MRKTILLIFVASLISCLPEGFSEKEIEPNSAARLVMEKYKALYSAKHLEIVHLKANSSVNALAIYVIDADGLPDEVDEKREIGYQIASDIFNTLDKELTEEVEVVDFGFKRIEAEFLTYNKSSIDGYRFINTNGELIPVFYAPN